MGDLFRPGLSPSRTRPGGDLFLSRAEFMTGRISVPDEETLTFMSSQVAETFSKPKIILVLGSGFLLNAP